MLKEVKVGLPVTIDGMENLGPGVITELLEKDTRALVTHGSDVRNVPVGELSLASE